MASLKVLVNADADSITTSLPNVILKLSLIGQMEASTPDQNNVLPLGRKTRALLAILALSAPRPVVRARLAELLWSRRHEEQARASLRQEIHRLLEALHPTVSAVINVTRDHISLRSSMVWIDVEEVLQATPDMPDGLELLKGRLLDEFDGIDPALDVWLAAQREHLQDRARAIGEALLRQQVDAEATIPVAQKLLRIDRAHEGAWRALMSAYAARGDRGMAVQAFERCRAVLREKLDSTPSPETQRLLTSIRSGIPAGRGDAPAETVVPVSGRARVGILPLQMMGTDTAETYLSLSLSDELAATLAVFRGVSVVSGSSLQQQGSRDEVVLRRTLGLDYLVDGSLQRSGGRLRITLRLMDLADGNRVVWARRFDRDASDLLVMQDDVAGEMAGLIYPQIRMLESKHAVARPLATATPVDLVIRASELTGRVQREDFDKAGDLLLRALALDETCAPGHAWRAFWLTLKASQGWTDDIEACRAEAADHVTRSIALAPSDPHCLALVGHVRSVLHRQPIEAREFHERALKLNPNLDRAIGLAAITLTFLGEMDAAGLLFERYARMAPPPLLGYYVEAGLTLFHLLQKDTTAAVRLGRRLTELSPHFTTGLRHYLSALGHAGMHREAEVVLRRLLDVEPQSTVQRWTNRSCLIRLGDTEHYAQGLRLGGLPEGVAEVCR